MFSFLPEDFVARQDAYDRWFVDCPDEVVASRNVLVDTQLELELTIR